MSVILVVEDEPLIRMNAAVLLEDEGYEVIEAATARAALAVLEKRNGEIRLACSWRSIAGVGSRLMSGRRLKTAPAVVREARAVAALRYASAV